MKEKKLIETLKQIIAQKDIEDNLVNRKKELVLKEYESLFTVYGRQTSIVNNFRGWTIALLTVYFTFLFTVHPTSFGLIYLPGLSIILTFYFLEVAERSVMRYLIQELRDLEQIFMIQNTNDFRNAILNYKFRDLRDEEKSFRVKVYSFLKATVNMKVILWNLFLILIYFALIFIFNKDFSRKPLNNSNTHIDNPL